MSLLPVEEALARILQDVRMLGSEDVPIDEAYDRVLAEDLAARRTQPPFAASAMDGYAVRAEDVATVPARLQVIGEAPAGAVFKGRVENGQAVRIFTGAPLPEGADAIVIQENTRQDGDAVEVLEKVRHGAHVRPAGLDFSEGEVLLEAGTRLRPRQLALAAAMNVAHVPVVRRPRVAILATGDELVRPGGTLGPGQIIASNSYGIAALVRRLGGDPADLGIVPDRAEATEKGIRTAREMGADVLVTLGGASVGDHDLVHGALEKEGVELGFWRIAMRPGKPLMFGRWDGMRVLGLPGNPVSSMVCGRVFLRPLLLALLGRPPQDHPITAVLGADVGENDRRQDYLRATLEPAADGGLPVATPFGRQDSSMLAMLAKASCLIVRPPHAVAAKAGERVEVLRLDAS